MLTFSALLVLGFLSQRPVTWSFDVFFDLCLNKRLGKQPRRWWFETSSRSLWRHCNEDEFDAFVQDMPWLSSTKLIFNGLCITFSRFRVKYTPFAKSNGWFVSDTKINMMPLSNLYDFWWVHKMHASVHFLCKIYWLFTLTRFAPGF